MRPDSLLAWTTAVLVYVNTSQAVTTYGCLAERSNKFREWCLEAASTLLMGHTGSDDIAWFPKERISYTVEGCTATIQGTGSTVRAMSIISSFDQLGSRCQNGYFFYDTGVRGELKGKTGWYDKRNLNVATGEKVEEAIPLVELPRAEDEWVVAQDYVERLEGSVGNKTRHNSTRDASSITRARKRSPAGTYFYSRSSRNLFMNLYRGAAVVLDVAPSALHYSMIETLGSRMSDTIDDSLTIVGSQLLRTGYAVKTGSTVQSCTLSIQLGTYYLIWRDMFNAYGDGGDIVTHMIVEAIADFFRSGYTAAIYHVDDKFGNLVFSFMLNIVQGQVTALPPAV